MSDLAVSKAGTITAGEDRFAAWKTKDGGYENTKYAQFDTLIEGMFDKARLLDIIKNFIFFSGDDKILGADQTIAALCEDIVGHYEENRQHELT